MGYLIKNRRTGWRVVLREFQAGQLVERWINRQDAEKLGFRPSWSVDEAKKWAKQLTHNASAKADSKRLLKLRAGVRERDRALFAAMPQPWWSQFCENWENRIRNPKRARIQCRAAAKVLTEVKVPHEEWGNQPRVFEGIMVRRRYSLDYAQRILKVINEFGAYLAYSTGTRFTPIRTPRGETGAALEAKKRSKEATPLRPEALEAVRAKLQPKQYNWLAMTVYFGLRPQEVDPALWVVGETKGQKYLKVTQPKLRYGKNTKLIPILFKEQVKALTLAQTVGVKRPLVTTVRKYLNTGRYGGRKGWVRWLIDVKGRSMLEASVWMGHRSLETTRRYYEEEDQLILENRELIK